jgi:hypothetical protein
MLQPLLENKIKTVVIQNRTTTTTTTTKETYNQVCIDDFETD